MVTREPTLKYLGGQLYVREGAFALDVRSFPGNSGSPVFRESGFADEPVLVGLISSGDEQLDFAIAEPVSRIVETLRLAEKAAATTQPTWTLGNQEVARKPH